VLAGIVSSYTASNNGENGIFQVFTKIVEYAVALDAASERCIRPQSAHHSAVPQNRLFRKLPNLQLSLKHVQQQVGELVACDARHAPRRDLGTLQRRDAR
jgi:hypothetical protein